jgi:hypothetical protein
LENSEQLYDSHSSKSTINTAGATAHGASAEVQSAARSETGGEGDFEACARSASAASVVQVRLGCDCRKDSECARDSFCVSFLSAFAPRVRSGAWIQKNSPRAVD